MATYTQRGSEILLESGTNELELLEFDICGNLYGINIAKVREIMMTAELVPMPQSAPEIEGVFMPRDKLITVVDLHKVLGKTKPENERGLFIICQFNGMDIGFHVSAVHGIQRISWKSIEKPPRVSGSEDQGIATGIAKVNGKIIVILDFEKIVSDLNRTAGLDLSGAENVDAHDIKAIDKHLVIAEDSQFLNRMIVNSLSDIGFKDIKAFPDGQAAWDYISSFRDYDGDVTEKIAAVITDIEMPQMDGHRLTKLIKSDDKLKKIPVFLFSSLINEQMYKKGLSVGADAQFSKPQIGALIERLIQMLS